MDRIKNSFDSLPIAVCFFDHNDVVRLINHRMLAIASLLRRGGIQTLAELQDALQSPPEAVRCLDPQLQIYQFPDGSALRFAREQIVTKAGVRYTQITAADVTELMQKQNQLKEENEKLAEANAQLRKLFAQMPEIIREEETLAMKLRVHDDIGHSILAARRALLRHADLKEIRAHAALWEQSISVLYRSGQMTVLSEPLEASKKRAEEMGVSPVCGRRAANAAPAHPERTGDPGMCGKLRPSRRGHGIVCVLSAEAGLHGGVPDQQRRGAEGNDYGGRRPFHAASARGRGGRQTGDSEYSAL